MSSSTLPLHTVSTPTYLNSSISISDTTEPFDGLDDECTPEEYIQHFEERITFSLEKTEHEYKVWQARGMTLIQCSLTGTALSWYIRLNDTYIQD